ncbi:hypothetical protein, partial [uncultured Lamprocystis sp.]|uniref:hypothetical protein n=1 Tax=uncultured Lamprocystis sp. TaxID=543132 RepID=UPI0025EE879D
MVIDLSRRHGREVKDDSLTEARTRRERRFSHKDTDEKRKKILSRRHGREEKEDSLTKAQRHEEEKKEKSHDCRLFFVTL